MPENGCRSFRQRRQVFPFEVQEESAFQVLIRFMYTCYIYRRKFAWRRLRTIGHGDVGIRYKELAAPCNFALY